MIQSKPKVIYQCEKCKAFSHKMTGQCFFCKNWNCMIEQTVVKKQKPISKISPKRKKEMESNKGVDTELDIWFEEMIKQAKAGMVCENCGDSLMYQIESEETHIRRSVVAHILAKRDSGFPSVATHPLNRVFLCGMFSNSGCHSQFDKNYESASKMPVFKIALERFNQFKGQIKEPLGKIEKYFTDTEIVKNTPTN